MYKLTVLVKIKLFFSDAYLFSHIIYHEVSK